MTDTSASLLRPDIPAEVWSKSGRPWQAQAMRFGLPAILLTASLFAAPGSTGFFVVIGVAVVILFGLLPVIDLYLGRIERQVLAARSRDDADKVLKKLRDDAFVQQFSPLAWRRLQEARIQLLLEDGRAAARGFNEAARLSGVGADKQRPLKRAEAENTAVRVDLSDQRAQLLVNDRVALDAPVCTGRAGKATPVGILGFLTAVPRGMEKSADIIFFIFIVVGAAAYAGILF